MITLRCECCGFVQTFADPEIAFQIGWDEPTHMPSWPVTCPLCPGVGSMGLFDHSEAHARWKRDGRPAEFDPTDMPAEVQEGARRLKEIADQARAEGLDDLETAIKIIEGLG